ncbi:MAG: hypothetical protein ACJ798_07300 [Phenylobacterium sp.]
MPSPSACRIPGACAALILALVANSAGASPALPRMPDGHADLSGVWTNASVTHLTRPRSVAKLALSPAEAVAYEKSDGMVRRIAGDSKPSDPNAGAPGEGDPGGYNTFWLDPGQKLSVVRGEIRTSWLVDPPDGQLPLSDAGRALIRQTYAGRDLDHPPGPETLEPWDRCLIASRGSGGPGMLNNIYNSNYQLMLTPGALMIEVEMIHDVRSIPILPSKAAAQAAHGPVALHPWLGDSTAWWEGQTLVVETVNVRREQGAAGPIYLSPTGRVTERLTRASTDQILYEFAVDDPVYYSRPWRAEMSLNALKDPLYEYACHEGNYAIVGILRGTRQGEAAATAAGPGGR